MPSDQNLTVGIGLDTSGFTKGERTLLESYARLMSRDKQLKGEIEKKPRSWGAAESIFESERKVKNNLAGLVNDLSNVRSGAEATRVVLGRLSETLRLGAAAGVGFAVGDAMAEGIQRAADKLDSFTEKWKALNKFNAGAADSNSLLGQIEKLSNFAEESRKAPETAGFIEGLVNKYVHANGVTANDLYEQAGDSADRESRLLGKRAVGLETQRVGRVEDSLSGNSGEAARAELNAQFDQRKSQIEAVNGVTSESRKSLLESNEQERSARLRDLDRKILQKRQDLKTAENLLKMRDAGATPSQIAREQVRAADLSQDFFGTDDDRTSAGLRSLEARDNLRSAQIAENTDASGNLLSEHTRAASATAARRLKRRRDESVAELNRTAGLTSLHRDSSGKIISGVDPATGLRRALNASEEKLAGEQSAADFKRRNSEAGKAEQLADQMFGRSEKSAGQGAEAQQAAAKGDAEKGQQGQNMEEVKDGIVSINNTLTRWDR